MVLAGLMNAHLSINGLMVCLVGESDVSAYSRLSLRDCHGVLADGEVNQRADDTFKAEEHVVHGNGRRRQ